MVLRLQSGSQNCNSKGDRDAEGQNRGRNLATLFGGRGISRPANKVVTSLAQLLFARASETAASCVRCSLTRAGVSLKKRSRFEGRLILTRQATAKAAILCSPRRERLCICQTCDSSKGPFGVVALFSPIRAKTHSCESRWCSNEDAWKSIHDVPTAGSNRTSKLETKKRLLNRFLSSCEIYS